MRKVDTIIVHCSDTTSGNVDSIRKYHIEHNGWNDIGYHFVILPSGLVEPGRPVNTPGAHTQGANAKSVGICLIGKKTFTEEQFKALRKLVGELRLYFGGIPVKGHNEFPSAKKQGKTCPNFDVKAALKY